MNFERFPIRVLLSMAHSDRQHWPFWWPIEEETRVIAHGQALICVPSACFFVPSQDYMVISATKGVSFDDVPSLTAGQLSLSAGLAQAFPCLLLTPQNLIYCYSHPLNGTTFFYRAYRDCLLLSTSLHDICRVTRSWQPDKQTVADYVFSLALVQTDLSASFVAGVRRIPPGSMAQLDDEGRLTVQPYWSPQRGPCIHSLAIKDAVHCVREAIHRVTRRAMDDADVIGVHCSGGVDSSTVAAFAQQNIETRGGKVLLFAAGPEVTTLEERRLQRTLAHSLSCELFEVHLDLNQDILPILRQANRYSSSPSNGLFAHINEVLAREASAQGVHVMLTGEGGEEVFSINELFLADCLRLRNWKAAYQCLCYLAAQSQNACESLIHSGLNPTVQLASNPRLQKLFPYLSGCLQYNKVAKSETYVQESSLYGLDYLAEKQYYQSRSMDDLRAAIDSGWLLNDYQAMQGLRALPPFDHQVDYSTDFCLHTASPLADLDVFHASLLLKTEEAVRLGIGFQNKLLLRYAAGNLVPTAVLRHPKINVADLPWRILHSHFDSILATINSSESLHQLGIFPHLEQKDFLQHGVAPLAIMQILILAIWLEELKRDVETYKNA